MPMPSALRWSYGGQAVSYERGTRAPSSSVSVSLGSPISDKGDEGDEKQSTLNPPSLTGSETWVPGIRFLASPLGLAHGTRFDRAFNN